MVKFFELLSDRSRSWCTLDACFWSTVCLHRERAKHHGNAVQIHWEKGKQKSQEMYTGDNKVNIRKVGLYYTNIVAYQQGTNSQIFMLVRLKTVPAWADNVLACCWYNID